MNLNAFPRDIEIVVATRASPLALGQAHQIGDQLKKYGVTPAMLPLTTHGDRVTKGVRDKEAFVAEIRQAVIRGDAHIAVHSLKDLPTQKVPGLTLIAHPIRAPIRDAVVSPKYGRLADMPAGARIGTNSLRRKAQLLSHYPDLQWVPMRGNVNTRLEKLERGDCEGLILARAGLERVYLDHMISEDLHENDWYPAAGQGALAVECRTDYKYKTLLRNMLDDFETRLCVQTERNLIHLLGLDCHAPAGCFANLHSTGMTLRAWVGTVDGKECARAAVETSEFDRNTSRRDMLQLSKKLAKSAHRALRKDGVRKILAQSV